MAAFRKDFSICGMSMSDMTPVMCGHRWGGTGPTRRGQAAVRPHRTADCTDRGRGRSAPARDVRPLHHELDRQDAGLDRDPGSGGGDHALDRQRGHRRLGRTPRRRRTGVREARLRGLPLKLVNVRAPVPAPMAQAQLLGAEPQHHGSERNEMAAPPAGTPYCTTPPPRRRPARLTCFQGGEKP